MKIEVNIGSIKTFIDVKDDNEKKTIEYIVNTLNDEYSTLIYKLDGKNINDKFLLMFLFLIIINRKKEIFANFESNIIKLILSVADLLYDDDSFDNQLVTSLILAKFQEMNKTATKEKKQKNIFDIVDVTNNSNDIDKLNLELEKLKTENQQLKSELTKTILENKSYIETINTKQTELIQTQTKLIEIQKTIQLNEDSTIQFLNKLITQLKILENKVDEK